MIRYFQVSFGLAAGFVAATVASTVPAAEPVRRQPVIQFLLSGDEAAIQLPRAEGELAADRSLHLQVFGRTLEKLTPRNGVVRFRVPGVRTVTPLTLSPSNDRSVTITEIFVYPQNARPPWNPEPPLQLATPAPPWIGQWLHAFGLPYEQVDAAQLKPQPLDESPGVLIVAGAAAGRTISEFDRRYRNAGQNVFLLSAPWFGSATQEDMATERLESKSLTGPLERDPASKWSRAVEFGVRQQPWAGCINRQTWITGQSAPIVEELFTDWEHGSVIAAYVPWQLQLGRNEIADQLFLDLLQAVSEHRPHRTDRRSIRLQYPPAGLPDAVKRPILTAAATRQPQMSDAAMLEVFDFRGPDAEVFPIETMLRDIRKRAGQSPVLVLGCDSLRQVERAIRREQKRSKQPHPNLTWVSSDRQPPSTQDQVHLMQVLTRLGVQLDTLSSTGVMK